VLLLIKESYSWLLVFHHWGASKLQRVFEGASKLQKASETEIISLTWDDVDAQNYFGSVKPYGL
jgi:hypothetical protein